MNTFTVIGKSTIDNKTKYRFTHDLVFRLKQLVKAGHTDVELVQLPYPMSKEQAIAYYTKPNTDAVWADINKSLVAQYSNQKPTFEMVLGTIPLRDHGKFIKKEVREQMAREKLAELLA